MREREFIQSNKSTKKLGISKVFVLLTIFVLATFAFAEDGQIHIIYANGSVSVNENSSTYEFDVQAYITDGSDVIGDGMVYVKYPETIFGDLAVYNNKVMVEKTGVLTGMIGDYGIDLYRIVNITDTYSDVFAVTFESNTNSASFKQYFNSISSDPSAPSDLLHITMDITTLDEGSVSFPTTIPGTDMLFYDYELETFSGGLDLSQANENISNPDDPGEEPVFVGNVELASFTASLKKSIVTLDWTLTAESNISEYIIQRSENGVDYNEIARLEAVESTKKFNRYQTTDKTTISDIKYSYRLDAVDTEGNIQSLSTTGIESKPGRKNVNYFLDNSDFALEASYPNPFNPSFTVPFTVSRAQDVDIKLYDMSGKIVATIASGYHTAGNYKINVDCNHLGSGVYLLRTIVNDGQSTQKMLLVK